MVPWEKGKQNPELSMGSGLVFASDTESQWAFLMWKGKLVLLFLLHYTLLAGMSSNDFTQKAHSVLLLGCYGKIVIVACRKKMLPMKNFALHCLAHSAPFRCFSMFWIRRGRALLLLALVCQTGLTLESVFIPV
jgi:hypothetical protein